jgi:hypothetical protein
MFNHHHSPISISGKIVDLCMVLLKWSGSSGALLLC